MDNEPTLLDFFEAHFAYERNTRSIRRIVETGEEFEIDDPDFPEDTLYTCVRVPKDHVLSPALPTRQIGRCIFTGREFDDLASPPPGMIYRLVTVPVSHVLNRKE